MREVVSSFWSDNIIMLTLEDYFTDEFFPPVKFIFRKGVQRQNYHLLHIYHVWVLCRMLCMSLLLSSSQQSWELDFIETYFIAEETGSEVKQVSPNHMTNWWHSQDLKPIVLTPKSTWLGRYIKPFRCFDWYPMSMCHIQSGNQWENMAYGKGQWLKMQKRPWYQFLNSHST